VGRVLVKAVGPWVSEGGRRVGASSLNLSLLLGDEGTIVGASVKQSQGNEGTKVFGVAQE